jgi:hypothetical protein
VLTIIAKCQGLVRVRTKAKGVSQVGVRGVVRRTSICKGE